MRELTESSPRASCATCHTHECWDWYRIGRTALFARLASDRTILIHFERVLNMEGRPSIPRTSSNHCG